VPEIPVVGEMRQVLETVFHGVVLKYLLLVGYAVGFALKLVVPAQPLIESRDFCAIKLTGLPVHGV
jgi:hypothetical protein